MKRFLNLVVYILTIHVSALLIAGLFRLVLFISSYHQLTSEALSDKTLPMLAFAHGVWFDNVIGCYILLLPLVVAVVCGVCNYYGKALFRFFTIFFSVFYGLVYLISAACPGSTYPPSNRLCIQRKNSSSYVFPFSRTRCGSSMKKSVFSGKYSRNETVFS